MFMEMAMKSTKRTYTIYCTKPLNEKQIANIQRLLGVDSIHYNHPKCTINYDLQFIDRQLIIRHLKHEMVECKKSLLHKIANALEIFSEKNIIKNNRLLPFYN